MTLTVTKLGLSLLAGLTQHSLCRCVRLTCCAACVAAFWLRRCSSSSRSFSVLRLLMNSAFVTSPTVSVLKACGRAGGLLSAELHSECLDCSQPRVATWPAQDARACSRTSAWPVPNCRRPAALMFASCAASACQHMTSMLLRLQEVQRPSVNTAAAHMLLLLLFELLLLVFALLLLTPAMQTLGRIRGAVTEGVGVKRARPAGGGKRRRLVTT